MRKNHPIKTALALGLSVTMGSAVLVPAMAQEDLFSGETVNTPKPVKQSVSINIPSLTSGSVWTALNDLEAQAQPNTVPSPGKPGMTAEQAAEAERKAEPARKAAAEKAARERAEAERRAAEQRAAAEKAAREKAEAERKAAEAAAKKAAAEKAAAEKAAREKAAAERKAADEAARKAAAEKAAAEKAAREKAEAERKEAERKAAEARALAEKEARELPVKTKLKVEEPMIGMPNPFEEVATQDEAAAIAGFTLAAPDSIPGHPQKTIQAISGELIQVDYSNGTDNDILIRKAKGTEDISGDYTVYPETRTIYVGNTKVTVKGRAGGVNCATWTQDGFSYALLDTQKPIPMDEARDLIRHIS
ncbi:MAG: cell envelope integrity protein TolA [Clostridia bacterium]|nr:cell envelope integrity protein TolA [Clostridia bacterium]